jgi:hypothetical protein
MKRRLDTCDLEVEPMTIETHERALRIAERLA